MPLNRPSILVSFALVMVSLLLGAARPAHAQTAAGVRAGLSQNPDQAYIGGHLETAPLVDRLRFRPNVELGFGDDVTLVAFNLEFVYPFPSQQAWHLYVGAGPAVNDYVFEQDSDVRGGFNLIIGGEHRGGLSVELKIGAIDSPNLKFGVGYTFR
jgi:hypothetical protein